MAGSFENCSDVAWEGHLLYKHSKMRGLAFAQYHPYWGILRRESSIGGKRVELFAEHSDVSGGLRPQVVLHLTDVLHVIERDSKGQRFAFQVLATTCKHHLATKTVQERQKWMDTLRAVLYGPPIPGIVYAYRVHVLPNSHSSQLQLVGHYVLKISDTELALYTANGSLPTRFRCELTHILRTRSTTFIKDRQKLSMLVIYTRSCSEISDGQFVFQSSSAADISMTIDHRVKEMSRGENKLEDGMPPSVTLNVCDPIGSTAHKFHSLPRTSLNSVELSRTHTMGEAHNWTKVDIPTQPHSYPTQPHSDFSPLDAADDIIPLYPQSSSDEEEDMATDVLDKDGYVETRRPSPSIFQPSSQQQPVESWKRLGEMRVMSSTPEEHVYVEHPSPQQERGHGKQNRNEPGGQRQNRKVDRLGSDGMGNGHETTSDDVKCKDDGDYENAIPFSPPSIVPGVSMDTAGESATFQLHYRKSTQLPAVNKVHAIVEAGTRSPQTHSTSSCTSQPSKPIPKPRKNADKAKKPTPAPRASRDESHDFKTGDHINKGNNPTSEVEDHMRSHDSHMTTKRAVYMNLLPLDEDPHNPPAGQLMPPQLGRGMEDSGVLFEEPSSWLGVKQQVLEGGASVKESGDTADYPYYLTILPPDHIPPDYQSTSEIVAGKESPRSPSLLSGPSTDVNRENTSSPLWGRSATSADSDRETPTSPGDSEDTGHSNGFLQPPADAKTVGRYSLYEEKELPSFLIHGKVHKTLSSSDYSHIGGDTTTEDGNTSNSGTGAGDSERAELLLSSSTHTSLSDGSKRTSESSDHVMGSPRLMRIPSKHRRSHSDVAEIGPFLDFSPQVGPHTNGENIYTQSLDPKVLRMAQITLEDTPSSSTPPPWSSLPRPSPVALLSLQRLESDSESEHSYTEPFLESEGSYTEPFFDSAEDEPEPATGEEGSGRGLDGSGRGLEGSGRGLDAMDGYCIARQVSIAQEEVQADDGELSSLELQSEQGNQSTPSDGYSTVKNPLQPTKSSPYTSIPDFLSQPFSAAPPPSFPPRKRSTPSDGYSVVKNPLGQTQSNPYSSVGSQLATPNSTLDPALIATDYSRTTSTDSGDYSFLKSPVTSNPFTSIPEAFNSAEFINNRPPAPLPPSSERAKEEISSRSGSFSGRRGSFLKRVKSHSMEDIKGSVIYEDLDRCYCYAEVTEEIRARRRVLQSWAEDCTYLTSKSSQDNHPTAVHCKQLTNGHVTETLAVEGSPTHQSNGNRSDGNQSDGSISPSRPQKLPLMRTGHPQVKPRPTAPPTPRKPVRIPPTPPPRPSQGLKRSIHKKVLESLV